MSRIKAFIKKYFSSFVFFYKYLKNKIFIALILSMIVSVLDGLGLAMFFPLLQVVDGKGGVDGSQMGNLSFLIDGIQGMGIHLTLFTVLLVMLIFFILKGIGTFLSRVYIVVLQQIFIRSIRLNLLDKLNRMSFKSFITSNAGRIQNTMGGEVDRVSLAYTYYFAAFQQGAMVAVYLGFAFFMDVQFAILVTVGGGLTNFLYKLIYNRTKTASRRLTDFNNVFQGQVIQHVNHFKYLRATGMVNKYAKRMRDTIYKIEGSRKKIGILSSIGMAAREPLLVIIISVVIFIQVKYFGGAIGTIIITLLFFYRALTFLVATQQSWNGFMAVSGSMENMQDFQKQLASNQEKSGFRAMTTFKDSVLLEKMYFSYGDTPILNDINLTIAKNESIAFVGESGSGKTTLVNLIAGLLPEDSGRVLVDGIPLNEINKQTYQNRIGYVSQDSVIFNDTIYNNVSFWAPKSEKNVQQFEESALQASLSSFLQDLPKGKETELGNNGINLSGGQKQRISIARELFKDIDLLILDEATSALDSETEKTIQESIEALQGQYTLLIVAHRLSTIRNVDRIVFMDKGNILDVGRFEELVKRQERFKKMVELQEL